MARNRAILNFWYLSGVKEPPQRRARRLMDFVKVFHEAMPLLLDGLKLTIGIALLAIALGMVIGFLSCIMGMSKNPVLRAISAVYVWLIRGTPMLVQAFFVFYAIPQLVKVMTGTAFTLTPFTAGAITLSLNAGAYISEIFRRGIQAVRRGRRGGAQPGTFVCQDDAARGAAASVQDRDSLAGQPVYHHGQGHLDSVRHRTCRGGQPRKSSMSVRPSASLQPMFTSAHFIWWSSRS